MVKKKQKKTGWQKIKITGGTDDGRELLFIATVRWTITCFVDVPKH